MNTMLGPIEIVSELVGKGRRLSKTARRVFVAAFTVYSLGFFAAVAAWTGIIPLSRPEVVGVPGLVALVMGLVVSIGVLEGARQVASEEKVEAAEERVRENPEKTQYAWDLARIKLENYLDRNLGHVTAIFYLTVAVMACGMGLIGFGVWRSIALPTTPMLPILSAASGIIVQIIGGTFLIIYRSTMDQARHYVVILERINAVGMSINILETIDDGEAATRNQARAELAKNLLGMYALPPKSGAE